MELEGSLLGPLQLKILPNGLLRGGGVRVQAQSWSVVVKTKATYGRLEKVMEIV